MNFQLHKQCRNSQNTYFSATVVNISKYVYQKLESKTEQDGTSKFIEFTCLTMTLGARGDSSYQESTD